MSDMDTERLYYEDSALAETTARIVSIEGEPARPVVVLDKTVFFPGGGGQPGDLGLLAGIAVSKVEEREGLVLHELAAPLPRGVEKGSEVRIAIDAERRREYVERHTGQHLVSAVLLRIAGAATRSVHHGPELSTIDFAVPSLDEETLSICEKETNRVIADDYRVMTHLCPPETLDSFALRRVPPVGKGIVRVVEIDGLDYTPCCGVHAPSTSYLRLVKIIGAERYKGLMRISFVAGDRAITNYKEVFESATASAKALGVSLPGIAEESARLLARCKELERERSALLREWAEREAKLAMEGADLRGAHFAFARCESSEPSLAEATARAIASRGSTGMIASEPDLTVHAAAPDSKAALAFVLGPIAAECGGKGGGGPTLFRASFLDRGKFEEFIKKASIMLSKP
jgi:alanyl-tRNA synthetase